MSLAEPRLVDAPAQPVLQLRLEVAPDGLGPAVGDALSRLTAHAIARGLGLGPTFVRRGAPGRVTVGVCVAASAEDQGEFELAELPESKLACAVWTGAFESLDDGHAALKTWAEAAGHTAAGAPWDVPITGPKDVARADEARTQLYLPLRG